MQKSVVEYCGLSLSPAPRDEEGRERLRRILGHDRRDAITDRVTRYAGQAEHAGVPGDRAANTIRPSVVAVSERSTMTTPQNDAGYAPFGFGYRRCAGELFTVAIIKEFLRRAWTGEFRFVTLDLANPERLAVGPGTVVDDVLAFTTS